ncbi:class I SAM-dependent methyltransferase [Metabacillus fastidiosus]|uniref:class I SAM-dependent methyltransferase n=1 Tax=Metabacillus fastidiosus TaxID=1458 RepID=UPI0008250034|nr:class I SAM-dependent methyltransferase [Metabacillus fastidiosus]MED4461194.1 class I SAM-dependent methyltransferase [Metabacillus fastidiosus]
MAWDQTWERVFQNQEWGKYPSEDLIRFIARNFYQYTNRKEIKILEVGCGTGANLWYIAREGFSVYGVDGSKTAVNKAKNRLDFEISNWNGELIVGDIISLPYENETFDAVIDIEAVSCNSFENSLLIYNEIYRVLKNDGKIFSRTFATNCWGDQTGQKIDYNTWIPTEGPLSNKGTVRVTSKEDVYKLFDKFEVVELEKLERTYNNLEQRIIEWLIIGVKK